MSPRGFRQCCRYHFQFVVDEFGFNEEPLPITDYGNPYQCRFVTDKVRIIVEGVHYGSGVDIAIGPFAEVIDFEGIKRACNDDLLRAARMEADARKNYARQYYLEDILAIRCPKLRVKKARRYDASERGIQKEQIKQFANALRDFCADLLRGDFTAVSRHPDVRCIQHLG